MNTFLVEEFWKKFLNPFTIIMTSSSKNSMTMIKILLTKLLPKTTLSFQDKVITIISSVAELQELKKFKELSNTSEDHFLISTGKGKQLCFMKMLLLFSAKSLAFLKEMATLDTKAVLKMKTSFSPAFLLTN